MSQGKKLTPLFDLLTKNPGLSRDGLPSKPDTRYALGQRSVTPDGMQSTRRGPVSVEPREPVNLSGQGGRQESTQAEHAQPVASEKPRIRLPGPIASPLPNSSETAESGEKSSSFSPLRDAKLTLKSVAESPPVAGGSWSASPSAVALKRVPKWAFLAGGLAVFALLPLLWMVAFKRGEQRTVEERVKPLVNAPAPKLHNPQPLTPSSSDMQGILPPSVTPQNSQNHPIPDPEVSNEPTQSPTPSPAQAPAQAPARARTVGSSVPLPNGIILPDGYVEQDPRLPGLNYLSLAVLGRDQAQQAVRYLGQNRVEAFAVPLDRDGSVINNAPPLAHRVYVGPGVTSQQYRANDPVMKQLESEVERLGKTWSKDFKGPSDFRSPGWIKYKGKS